MQEARIYDENLSKSGSLIKKIEKMDGNLPQIQVQRVELQPKGPLQR